MHIKRVRLGNFMSHKKTEIDLPETGVVLVTGNNGAGKSAFVEGVAMAIHGKTLRGTNPFHEGGKGLAEVEFLQHSAATDGDDTYCAKLRWTGKTKQHEWRKNNAKNDYETNTKSFDALASVVGSFDIWRRTHVFSSSDASSFTQATDAQRKQLLESLLGIDWFDDALKRCRDELKVAKPRLERLQKEGLTLLDDVAKHHADIASHKKEHDSLIEPLDDATIEARQSKLKQMVHEAKKEMDQAHAKAHRLQTAGEVEAREASNLKRKATEMPDECFTCGQDIPPTQRIAVLQTSTDKLKEAKIKRADGQKELRAFQEEMDELGEDLRALEEKLQEINILQSTAQTERAHFKYVKDALATAMKRAKDLAARSFALEDEMSAAAVDIAELNACAAILGFKGVRAQVLGHALSGIEQMANFWLSRLVGEGLKVTLSSYKETKAGNSTDSISLSIDGAGGGHGYEGASGGERRRIDVAILFALAEVAANVHGTQGTLFFDEVFDALDADGMAAVTDALCDLSKKRAVVVITHTHIEDLAKVATSRFHVEDGGVVC